MQSTVLPKRRWQTSTLNRCEPAVDVGLQRARPVAGANFLGHVRSPYRRSRRAGAEAMRPRPRPGPGSAGPSRPAMVALRSASANCERLMRTRPHSAPSVQARFSAGSASAQANASAGTPSQAAASASVQPIAASSASASASILEPVKIASSFGCRDVGPRKRAPVSPAPHFATVANLPQNASRVKGKIRYRRIFRGTSRNSGGFWPVPIRAAF